MCINYHIHWFCDHIVPLDDEPLKRTTYCTTYLATKAKANPTASVTCPLGLTDEEFKSDEVCPACAARFLGLTERARGRMAARRAGVLVDEMDEDVTESRQEVDAWLAKQKQIQERVEAVLLMLEKGMIDGGVLVEWFRQIGLP